VVVQLVVVGGRLFGQVGRPLARFTQPLVAFLVPHREGVGVAGVESERPAHDFTVACVHPLACADTRAAVALEHGLAFVDGQACLAGPRVDAVDAAAARLDHAPRRLELEITAADLMHVDAPRPEAEDDAIAGVVEVIELRLVIEPEEGAGFELELDASAIVGPNPVAGQEGDVRLSLFRGGLGRALDGHPVLDVTDAPVPIVLVARGRDR
jgi:hypothetical protein